MTESEWWAATDPFNLALHARMNASATARKQMLISLACCREVQRQLVDWPCAKYVDNLEQFADDDVLFATASPVSYLKLSSSDADIMLYFALQAGGGAAEAAVGFAQRVRTANFDPNLSRAIHDIFGPLPFRDVVIAPGWLTSDVKALAQGIYYSKTFDQMPILADAFQDVGCDNDEILNHCRAANWEHVRGCWVLDLLLGRPWRESV